MVARISEDQEQKKLKRSSMALMALALAATVGCDDSKSKEKPTDGEDCVGDACEGTGDGDTGDGDTGDGDTGDGDTGDGDGDGVKCSDGPDSDSDGVSDDCDVCPGADDKADVDGDGAPDACDLCEGEAGPRALLWDGESGLTSQHHAQKGIELVGCAYDRTSAATFGADLQSGKYQVLVVDLPANLPAPVAGILESLAPAVTAFANNGGGVIFSGASSLWPSGVVDMFAAESTSALEAPASFTLSQAGAPFDLSQVTFTPSAQTAVGQGLQITNYPFSLPYASTEAGVTTVARGMAGRAFGNAFTLDDYEGDANGDKLVDVETLIGNQYVAIAQSLRNELYALPWDFYEWQAEHAEVLARAVTYRAQPTQWDGAPKVRLLTTCADMEEETDGENTPGGPYAGEVNSMLAAFKHAGIPEADIGLLADDVELKAALGSFDVLVLPEHEDCTPDALLFRPLLLQHIHNGGRLVFAGYTQSFLNSVSFFGFRHSDVDEGAEVTLADDEFWGDIQSISSADATGPWGWADEGSAPGLEPLATDEGGGVWVFRSRYQVQPWAF